MKARRCAPCAEPEAPTCQPWPWTVSDPHPPRHRFAFSTEEVRRYLHERGDLGALAEQVAAARVRIDCVGWPDNVVVDTVFCGGYR